MFGMASRPWDIYLLLPVEDRTECPLPGLLHVGISGRYGTFTQTSQFVLDRISIDQMLSRGFGQYLTSDLTTTNLNA